MSSTGLERQVDRETLRYAVGRSIFYSCCDRIADVRDAVLVTTVGERRGAVLYCHRCLNPDFEAALDGLVADGTLTAFEVLDSAKLGWGPAPASKPAPKLEPELDPTEVGEQLTMEVAE